MKCELSLDARRSPLMLLLAAVLLAPAGLARAQTTAPAAEPVAPATVAAPVAVAPQVAAPVAPAVSPALAAPVIAQVAPALPKSTARLKPVRRTAKSADAETAAAGPVPVTTGSVAKTAAIAVPGAKTSSRCTRMAFEVNDWGKDGPTKDAQALLDKHVASWAAQKGIKKYTVGKKIVNCRLFLDFGFADEHTCRAEAPVCW